MVVSTVSAVMSVKEMSVTHDHGIFFVTVAAAKHLNVKV